MPMVLVFCRWKQEGSEVQGHLYLHKEFQDSLAYTNETLPQKGRKEKKKKEEEEKEGWGNLYVAWGKLEMGSRN